MLLSHLYRISLAVYKSRVIEKALLTVLGQRSLERQLLTGLHRVNILGKVSSGVLLDQEVHAVDDQSHMVRRR